MENSEMENKKLLPLKIVHFILMVAAFVLCVVALLNGGTGNAGSGAGPIIAMCCFINALILITVFLYMFMGYGKKVAPFYRAFMIMLIVENIISLAYVMSSVQPPIYYSFSYIIALVMTDILAFSKDLGKKKTYVTAAILLICRAALLVFDSCKVVTYGEWQFSFISTDISFLLLAGTAILMVAGKYLDKDARGTK